jgi:hypothetical protein
LNFPPVTKSAETANTNFTFSQRQEVGGLRSLTQSLETTRRIPSIMMSSNMQWDDPGLMSALQLNEFNPVIFASNLLADTKQVNGEPDPTKIDLVVKRLTYAETDLSRRMDHLVRCPS